MMAIGLAEQTLFFRGLLDKLQVKPLPSLRGEYKTAYNCLTHKGYSKAHREASQAWLNSCMKQLVGDVALARGLSHKQVLLPVPALHPHLYISRLTAAGFVCRDLHDTADVCCGRYQNGENKGSQEWTITPPIHLFPLSKVALRLYIPRWQAATHTYITLFLIGCRFWMSSTHSL